MTDATDPQSELWRRPRPGSVDYRADLWGTALLTAGTLLSAFLTRTAGLFDDSPWWMTALWALCITLPLAVRRRFPEAVALVVSLVFCAGIALGTADFLFSNICLYLAIYTVGAWSRQRVLARWIRVTVIAGMFVWLFWQLIGNANQASAMPQLSRDGMFSPYAAYGLLQVLINLVYFGAAYHFGDTAWQSARGRAALAARTRQLEEEQQRNAAQAVTLERVRIARELHDVVAHHVSVMGVQAGAARRILDHDPLRAADSLAIIEESARTAVDELNTMLVALRSDDDDTGAGTGHGASTRGVAQLEELAAECRAAGVPVTVSIIGEPRIVPATIGLSIYRVAQEALTNTRKHAGAGARADLRIRYRADGVELEVTDDGISSQQSAPPAGRIAAGGLGHRGMQERVSAVGGELQLGARIRGGYLVRARFPLMSQGGKG
jgi:signal transduction histidine kinase